MDFAQNESWQPPRHLDAGVETFDALRWNSILEGKFNYLQEGVDPRTNPRIKPEISDSWIRSVENHINPAASKPGTIISESALQRLQHDNKPLIKIVRTLFGNLDQLDLSEDYLFEIISREGVSLYAWGNGELYEHGDSHAVLLEKTSGTSAHALCMRHRRPFQVIGPEHFCFELHGLAASAAPVFNKKDEVIGSLVLTRPIPPPPWSTKDNRLLVYGMGLVVSLATAITSQLRFVAASTLLLSTRKQLDAARSLTASHAQLLETTIQTSGEALILLDQDLTIRQISPEACKRFSLDAERASGQPVGAAIKVLNNKEKQELLNVAQKTEIPLEIAGGRALLKMNPVTTEKNSSKKGIILRFQFEEETQVAALRGNTGETAQFTFGDILGESETIKGAISLAKHYARTTASILIIGESGTGKECFAQAIHNESRPQGPFMSLNCAAIPSNLIESELFGYEGGSFTGAERRGKPGKIELAHRGTLFLDEVGDMPAELQTALLRVLENKQVLRLGGKQYKKIDFRIITATNRNLHDLMKAKLFREDLFYRLAVLALELPPLREREQDSVLFASHFLQANHEADYTSTCGFAAETTEIIRNYSWPGNVRQLKNTIEAACFIARGFQIEPSDLPTYLMPKKNDARPSKSQEAFLGELPNTLFDMHSIKLKDLERAAIKMALQQTAGNVTKAAEQLGVGKTTLYRKIKEYRIL